MYVKFKEESDGKLCVITDDKGAGGKIESLFKRTNSQNKGARIVIFSTPKLVQFMYREKAGLAEEDLVEMLSAGVSGNITIMGTSVYDLDVNLNISMTSRELAVNIMQENGINIIF